MTTDCYCFLYCFLYCHSVDNRQVQVRACQHLCGIQLSTIGQVGQLAMTCGQAAPTLHPLPFTRIFWPPHIQVIYAYGILLTISSFHIATCCVSSVCMPSCNVSCWWSHTPGTLLKMSQKFHGCVFYHWRMSACFSHQNGSEHLDNLIDLSFCCINSLRGLLCLRHFVTLSLRHLPKCLCNLTQFRVLLAQSSTWQGQNKMMDLPCDDTFSHEDRWWGMTRYVKVCIATKNAIVGTERFSLLLWQLPLWQDMASPTTTMCAIDV